jgi:hypothetical protein
MVDAQPRHPDWKWHTLIRALVRKTSELEARVQQLETGKRGERVQVSAQTTALVRRMIEERTPAATEAVSEPSGDESYPMGVWPEATRRRLRRARRQSP